MRTAKSSPHLLCVMRPLVFFHVASLVSLFTLGIILLFFAASWFVFSGNWMGTAALLIVAASNIGLALFGRKNVGVVAATVISAFWTVSASVAFAKEACTYEAWALILSSLFQVTSAAFSYIVAPTSSPLLDPEGYLPPQYFSQHNSSHPTSYGALSHFVDPLSVVVPPPAQQQNGGRTASVSSSVESSSPTVKRVPSPFGNHKFHNQPHLVSAAILDPAEEKQDLV